MDKRKLGRSGLEIAPLVLGGNVFGWTADEATSFKLLDRFVERGFNAIDTADVYSAWAPGLSGGESETVMGKWLARRGRRDDVVIMTKVGSLEARKGLKAGNIAADPTRKASEQLQQSTFSTESLVSMDPDKLFVDLSTLQGGAEVNALNQLRTEAPYRVLSAVEKGEIYGVLPYNWYSQNHGSILADAYFIGKVLYPERFEDVDPVEKADEIYTFLVGKPVFDRMNEGFGSMVFKKIDL